MSTPRAQDKRLYEEEEEEDLFDDPPTPDTPTPMKCPMLDDFYRYFSFRQFVERSDECSQPSPANPNEPPEKYLPAEDKQLCPKCWKGVMDGYSDPGLTDAQRSEHKRRMDAHFTGQGVLRV